MNPLLIPSPSTGKAHGPHPRIEFLPLKLTFKLSHPKFAPCTDTLDTRAHDNLPREERQALSSLKNRSDIIIKPADKGSAVVVMDRQQYIDEAMKHLNNRSHYALPDSDPTCNFSLQIQSTLNDMKEQEHLSDKAHKFLSPTNAKPARFYLLPKIHKPGNPGRPILSGNGSPTENISLFHYLQIFGTAMGTRMAPSFACLFMTKLEQQMLDSAPCRPWIWWRYIDDIFFIWTREEDSLHTFIDHINSFHRTIKFTSDFSQQETHFLDVTVQKKPNGITTTLYT
ncbi:uncharacterized protein LOC135153802 [Lytechinus pictus]|uniref:uncharacterized protein LOC135153802 n=1 Tax=Lytechinus pictus TaxID=7653 RepID=UPI0030B9C773